METLFLYLIKVSGLIALFFGAYYLLLRKETFFSTNRWFLLVGLFTSVLLPLVTFKKIIWVAPAQQLAETWVSVPSTAVSPAETVEINWALTAALIYAIGIFIFFIKFIFDFGNLVLILKGKTVTQQADFKYINVSEKVSPFSYFNYIVYNPELYTKAELDNILEHEKVHCEQRHSVDVLIARFFRIVFWYNPFVWLYQKAMLQNLEFIADSEALKNIADKKAYQITLLKVTTHDNCVAITNHFYQSLIKKRIIMLNKNQSKQSSLWKYAVIIPALAAFLFYFQVKVIAQEKNPVAATAPQTEPITVTIDKNTTDAQMKEHEQQMKAKGVKLNFRKVKRNSAGEITSIKAEYKDASGHKGAYVISGDEPIKPISIFRKDNGNIGFGNGERTLRIIRRGNDVADSDNDDDDDDDVIDPIAPVDPTAPVAPEEAEDVIAYSYEMPELGDLDNLDNLKDKIVVKTRKGKNGKVTVSVNGQDITVDPDQIMADIDIEKIQRDAEIQVERARRQIDAARPQIERARKRMAISKSESDDMRQEMEEARNELEQSRRELEESRKQLEESKREFEAQKAKQQSKKSK